MSINVSNHNNIYYIDYELCKMVNVNSLNIIKVKDSRIQGFKLIYLQQPIHFDTVLINKTYSTITRQIEITNNH